MPAPVRVSIDQIKDALHQTKGNVEHAAALVAMSANNLRKRLGVAGIDVNTFRATAPTDHRAPLMAVTRLQRETLEKLRQAAFDLAYVRRREHTQGEILEEFIAEAFGPWLATKLADKGGRS